MFSPLEQFNTIIIDYMGFCFCLFGEFKTLSLTYSIFGYIIDLTFFNLLIPLILLRAFFYFFYSYFRKYDVFYLVPKTIFQRFYEFLIIFIFNLIKQQLGSHYYSYLTFIFSIFYGILLLNLISLVPLGVALTSHIELMVFLSLSLGLGIFILGLEKKGLDFF
jgi:F0F1-type ATP synthase membrane subunit a